VEPPDSASILFGKFDDSNSLTIDSRAILAKSSEFLLMRILSVTDL
jgi:hypothetical protein